MLPAWCLREHPLFHHTSFGEADEVRMGGGGVAIGF